MYLLKEYIPATCLIGTGYTEACGLPAHKTSRTACFRTIHTDTTERAVFNPIQFCYDEPTACQYPANGYCLGK